MKIIADTHTHTLASDHAYSTIIENVAVAKEKGLRILCITEHTQALNGAPSSWFHGNLRKTLPRELDGVELLAGAELNIMDTKGNFDIEDFIIEDLDWVIASLHAPCFPPTTSEDHTNSWLAVAKNPLVHVIGHSGDPRFLFDQERCVEAFKKYGKIVEINAHSFFVRAGSYENCRSIALLCKEYEVPLVASSDAHFAINIGKVAPALEMLREIDYPEELILNTDYDRFTKFVNQINSKVKDRIVFPL